MRENDSGITVARGRARQPLNTMKARASVNHELDLATFAFDAFAKACLVAAFLLLLPIGALTVAEFVFGYHSYALETRELAPNVAPGTLIISHPVAASDLAVGDMVALHPPDAPSEVATRRVSSLTYGNPPNDEELIYTRADSSSRDDPWVIPGGATVDRVVMTIPVVGAPAAALQSTTARLLFLVLPAVLLLLVLLNELVRRFIRRPVLAEAL